jgi:DNA-directed RNA polymerase specialized sigma24 family protein
MWQDRAACRGTDPDIWVHEPSHTDWSKWVEFAREHLAPICDRCPVREACLADALAHKDEGFRAGTNERERRAMTPPAADERSVQREARLDQWAHLCRTMTRSEIADLWGMSLSGVDTFIGAARDNGDERADPTPVDARFGSVTDNDVIRLHADGLSQTDIARELKTAVSTVNRRLERLGLRAKDRVAS